MTTQTQIAAFKVGKTYACRSIGDQDCVWTFTITKRTKSTVTTKCGKTFRINKRLTSYRDAEAFYPLGNYSMAPVLSANKVVA